MTPWTGWSWPITTGRPTRPSATTRRATARRRRPPGLALRRRQPAPAYGAGPHDPAGRPAGRPRRCFHLYANGSTTSKAEPAAGITDQYGYNFDNRMSWCLRRGRANWSPGTPMTTCPSGPGRISSRTAPQPAPRFVYGHEGLLAEYDETGAPIRNTPGSRNTLGERMLCTKDTVGGRFIIT